MSYPQTDADKYVQSGFKFFRLLTPLGSDGDIYESAQGAQAFALGPNSDISRVNIGYQDPNAEASGRLVKAQISPHRSFTGLVNAPNGQGLYLPSGRPGKILIWPDEVFNADWTPDFVDAGSRLDFVAPVLDVIQYFEAPDPTLDPQRSDKTYTYQTFPFPADVSKAWILAIPFYGRRYMSIRLKNARGSAANPDNTIDFTAFGVQFGLTDDTASNDAHLELGLHTSASLLGGVNYVFQYRASVGASDNVAAPAAQNVRGLFDYIMLEFGQADVGDGGPTPLHITVSDNEP